MHKNSDIHLYVGQALGHYQLLHPLDQRGAIEIWQAQHVNLHMSVALKILPLHGLREEDYQRYEGRLRHEAGILATLHHAHIVGFRDYVLWRNFLSIVMQYAPNGSMAGYHSAGRKLPLSLIRLYMWQIGQALSSLHQLGWLHRDVKPGNILLLTPHHALLADFGLALRDLAPGYPQKLYPGGTAAYMAPEQHRGHPCPASDQYSLAICVYEWLTGHRPFSGEVARGRERFAPPPVRNHRPELPLVVEKILLTALDPHPANRYPDVMDFVRAFVEKTRFARAPLVRRVPYYREARLRNTAELDNVSPTARHRMLITGEQRVFFSSSVALPQA